MQELNLWSEVFIVKKRIFSLAIILLVSSAACSAATQTSVEVSAPSFAENTDSVAATPVPTPEPTPEPTPTPEPRNPEWTDDFDPVTGWDMIEKLGAGITFADCSSEKIWGDKERIEQWHLQAIARKGFNSVLFSVAWEPYMNENAVIEPLWLDRIQQVIDWALDAGLNVILGTGQEANRKRH